MTASSKSDSFTYTIGSGKTRILVISLPHPSTTPTYDGAAFTLYYTGPDEDGVLRDMWVLNPGRS